MFSPGSPQTAQDKVQASELTTPSIARVTVQKTHGPEMEKKCSKKKRLDMRMPRSEAIFKCLAYFTGWCWAWKGLALFTPFF